MNQPVTRVHEDSRPATRRGFLAPYRVLDLSNERGLLAGWLLARLGADVVQLEPPEGSSARRVGPFAGDAPAGENSLFWSVYASSKRSLCCDTARPAGAELLQRLIAKADVLIDTPLPGTTPHTGVDAAALRAAHPRLIHVMITPFGSSGPKAAYAESDLVIWAAAGLLYPSRDSQSRPLRISVPQSYLHAGADAATAALIALFARHHNGRGQTADISAQASASLATLSTTLAAAVGHDNYQFPAESPQKKKDLDLSGSGSRTRRSKWPVADGLLELHLGMGPASGGSANKLFAWMIEEHALPAEFHGWDWIKLPQQIMADEITEEQIDRAREAVAAFVRPRRKQEFMDVAMKRGILMAPAMTTGDLLASEQLRAREFFASVREGGRERIVPTRFAAGCEAGFAPVRPAPRLGEHSAAVCAEWLELGSRDAADLAQTGAGA